MNYGLYLSASGVLSNLYRQDVFANNLANAQTVGFKADIAAIRPRAPESLEEGFGFDLANDLLDRLGGGAFAGPQFIDFTAGQLTKTDNPLDVALDQDNRFFAVAATGPDGQRQVFLTRDGRFATDAEGYLVTATGGHQVLDSDDQPIQLDLTAGAAFIDDGGRLRQNDQVLGQLQIAAVTDRQALKKYGGNLFRIDGPETLRRVVDEPTVIPRAVESSGSDPIKQLMNLIDATKAVTSSANLIRYHDSLMDRAVNVLGRVLA